MSAFREVSVTLLRVLRHLLKRMFIVAGCLAAALGATRAGTAEPDGTYDCIIEARQSVEIRSPVEAIIESVKVQRGDLVARGQVIATLHSGPERAAHELAKSRAQTQGEIKVAEARVAITEKKLRRAEELFTQNFISANARDEAHADFQLATEDLGRTRENQKLAGQEAQRTGEVLALRTITSPFSGVVVEVMLKPGEFGATTIKDPIMKLAEIDPLNVEVILPISLYKTVRIGQRATVAPEAPIGGSYSTTVKVVDRVIDAKSGTFGVRLELPNPKRAIPAGARCRIQFSDLDSDSGPGKSSARPAKAGKSPK
jgi:RND family efflux transporter MFP subunit